MTTTYPQPRLTINRINGGLYTITPAWADRPTRAITNRDHLGMITLWTVRPVDPNGNIGGVISQHSTLADAKAVVRR